MIPVTQGPRLQYHDDIYETTQSLLYVDSMKPYVGRFITQISKHNKMPRPTKQNAFYFKRGKTVERCLLRLY